MAVVLTCFSPINCGWQPSMAQQVSPPAFCQPCLGLNPINAWSAISGMLFAVHLLGPVHHMHPRTIKSDRLTPLERGRSLRWAALVVKSRCPHHLGYRKLLNFPHRVPDIYAPSSQPTDRRLQWLYCSVFRPHPSLVPWKKYVSPIRG